MKTHLNLIPTRTRSLQEFRFVLRIWVKATFFTLALCLCFVLSDWFHLNHSVSQLTALDAQYAPLQELLTEQQSMEKQAEVLERRRDFALRYSSGLDGVSLLGVVSRAAAEMDGAVYLKRLEFSSTKGEGGALKLYGEGADGLSAASFAQRLRESGFFNAVNPGAKRRPPPEAPAPQAFELECIF